MDPQGPVLHKQVPFLLVPTVPTGRDPLPGIQRFYQDFRLPNYPLDIFSGRLFDVVSCTTFVTSDTQTEPHCAITRLIFFFLFINVYIYIYLGFNFLFCKICYLLNSDFDCTSPSFFLCTDCLTYMNQGCVI